MVNVSGSGSPQDFQESYKRMQADGRIDQQELEELAKAAMADGKLDEQEKQVFQDMAATQKLKAYDLLQLPQEVQALFNTKATTGKGPGKIDSKLSEFAKRHLPGVDSQAIETALKVLQTLDPELVKRAINSLQLFDARQAEAFLRNIGSQDSKQVEHILKGLTSHDPAQVQDTLKGMADEMVRSIRQLELVGQMVHPVHKEMVHELQVMMGRAMDIAHQNKLRDNLDLLQPQLELVSKSLEELQPELKDDIGEMRDLLAEAKRNPTNEILYKLCDKLHVLSKKLEDTGQISLSEAFNDINAELMDIAHESINAQEALQKAKQESENLYAAPREKIERLEAKLKELKETTNPSQRAALEAEIGKLAEDAQKTGIVLERKNGSWGYRRKYSDGMLAPPSGVPPVPAEDMMHNLRRNEAGAKGGAAKQYVSLKVTDVANKIGALQETIRGYQTLYDTLSPGPKKDEIAKKIADLETKKEKLIDLRKQIVEKNSAINCERDRIECALLTMSGRHKSAETGEIEWMNPKPTSDQLAAAKETLQADGIMVNEGKDNDGQSVFTFTYKGGGPLDIPVGQAMDAWQMQTAVELSCANKKMALLSHDRITTGFTGGWGSIAGVRIAQSSMKQLQTQEDTVVMAIKEAKLDLQRLRAEATAIRRDKEDLDKFKENPTPENRRRFDELKHEYQDLAKQHPDIYPPIVFTGNDEHDIQVLNEAIKRRLYAHLQKTIEAEERWDRKKADMTPEERERSKEIDADFAQIDSYNRPIAHSFGISDEQLDAMSAAMRNRTFDPEKDYTPQSSTATGTAAADPAGPTTPAAGAAARPAEEAQERDSRLSKHSVTNRPGPSPATEQEDRHEARVSQDELRAAGEQKLKQQKALAQKATHRIEERKAINEEEAQKAAEQRKEPILGKSLAKKIHDKTIRTHEEVQEEIKQERRLDIERN